MPHITRRFGFDAGHRILNHESKCANLHGHRYTADVTVMANDLDPLGRVVDFSVVKDLIGEWIDEYWDHTMILHGEDPLLKIKEDRKLIFGPKPPYIIGKNPTAENLAAILLAESQQLFTDAGLGHLYVRRVVLYETPNCWASEPGL